MKNNIYWSIYKNLEREIIDLANLVHFDDKQLTVYSIKISELLIRTVVEIESISKELYFMNGGTKPDDSKLFFDTDCIDLLEKKWLLSKKVILVSSSNFYFTKEENRILKPLYKANKRGSSSSDWQKSYQSVKHNRAKNLAKGTISNLIRAMAGLFLLNIYYKDLQYDLEKDATGTNFDNGLGSAIFSCKIHINSSINAYGDNERNADFDECTYILLSTLKTREEVKKALNVLNEKANAKINSITEDEILKKLSKINDLNQEEFVKNYKVEAEKLKTETMIQVAKENTHILKKSIDDLRYEAILNKNSQ